MADHEHCAEKFSPELAVLVIHITVTLLHMACKCVLSMLWCLQGIPGQEAAPA